MICLFPSLSCGASMLESRFLQAHTKDSRRRTVRLESTASTTTSSTTAVTSEAATSTATERHFVLVVVWVFVRGSGSGRLSRRDTGELNLFETFALRDRSESRLEGAASICCVGDSWRVDAAQRKYRSWKFKNFLAELQLRCMTRARSPWRSCGIRCSE